MVLLQWEECPSHVLGTGATRQGVEDPTHVREMEQVTEPRRLPKTAEELIPGSPKRSMSYAEELAKVSRETLEQIARDRNSPLRQYCGQNLGCLIGNDAIVTERFVSRAGFLQTLPVG